MASETSNHEHYEELCALAASGLIPAGEFAELSHHIRACAACQASYARFTQILHTQQLLVDSKQTWSTKLANFFLRSNKHKKRFLSYVKERGVQFPEETETRPSFWSKLPGFSLPSVSYRYAVASVIIVLLLMVGILGHRWRESFAENAAQSAENAAQSAEIVRLSGGNNRLNDANQNLHQQVDALVAQLSRTRRDSSALATLHNQLKEELQQASLALQSLKAESEASKQTADNKLQEAEQTLRAMAAELDGLRQARSQDASVIVSQNFGLEDLSRRLQEQTEILERERRLLVADRDIRELMGARNLHIYDVFDTGHDGKYKQSFGRVFYTEGKSLIFYAFDLNEPNFTNAKHSFQVWGQRKGSSAAAVSLGIFYIDNAEQRRWVLKFEDPEVLRQINTVFVTVEPFGGGKRPTGEKLLYAFLSNKPNHP